MNFGKFPKGPPSRFREKKAEVAITSHFRCTDALGAADSESAVGFEIAPTFATPGRMKFPKIGQISRFWALEVHLPPLKTA